MQPDFEVGKSLECSKAKDTFDCKIKPKMKAGCRVAVNVGSLPRPPSHDEWPLKAGARGSCMKTHPLSTGLWVNIKTSYKHKQTTQEAYPFPKYNGHQRAELACAAFSSSPSHHC